MRLGKVTWNDANGYYGWQGDEGDFDTALCISVGWLTVTKTEVIVLQSACPDNTNVMGIVVIPKGCVKKIEYVPGKRWEYMLEGEKPGAR